MMRLFRPSGSFEIEIDGQLIFSKLETGGFPYEDDVSVMWGFTEISLDINYNSNVK